MLEFHASDWLMRHLRADELDAMANIEYARCIADDQDKLVHYQRALQKHPFVVSWNEEYLSCLLRLNHHDAAYEHALKFKTGPDTILRLAQLVEYHKSVKLYDILMKQDVFSKQEKL